MTRALLCLAMIVAASCASPASPTLAPRADPNPAVSIPEIPTWVTPPKVIHQSAGATLEVDTFQVALQGIQKGFQWYLPTVVLRETEGRSAATIQTLLFTLPDGNRFWIAGGDAPLGVGCLLTRESRTVPAGGEWRSTAVYRYCLDLDSYDLTGMPVTLNVRYTDENGSLGEIQAVAIAK